MKTRTGLLVTTALSAVMAGTACVSQAQAADQPMPTKAPPAQVETGWWQNGVVEIGGRFFLDKHGGGTGGNCLTAYGSCPTGTLPILNALASPAPFQSLGKFYEYRDLRPGPFGDISVAGGSKDGLYQYDFIGKNIGYRDQSYWLGWSQAGVQYFDLGFDQTPHEYNNNATTIFQGAGSDTLTIPLGVRQTLNGLLGPTNAGNGNNTVTAATAGGIAQTIEGNLNGFRLGYDRYSGTAAYRWTPDEHWDVRVDYNVQRRDGTQPSGALTYNGVERGGRVVLEMPKPIHDETHNANLNAEYAGTSPWNMPYNLNVGYGFSAYRDDSDSFTFQNPWAVTNQPQAPVYTPLNNLMSLPPDNTANVIRANLGANLPWKSRYVGAVNYTMTQQDQGFLPFTGSGNGVVGYYCTFSGSTCTPHSMLIPPTITGSSSFQANNLLVNNVLTTRWTPDLSQTSRYRYYNYDGSHDPVSLSYLLLDDSANAINTQFDSHGVAYTKQNASTEVVWHPAAYRWLNLGGGVAWERWDRDWRGQDPGLPDVQTTNEWTGKVFATVKPWDWSQFRASYFHAERRYDGTYLENIGGNDPFETWRAYDLANRNRDKANFYWDFYAPHNIVITPTGGFRFDNYTHDAAANGDPTGLLGLLHDNSWNAGLELSWTITPGVTMIGSYTREQAHRELRLPSASDFPTSIFASNVNDNIDTFMVGGNFAVIPDKLDVKVTYTYVRSVAQITGYTTATNPWPDTHNNFNRVDVQAKYKVDPSVMQRLGVKGQTYVKLRYVWEDNQVTDFDAVNWNYFYMFNGYNNNKALFLGWNNPNYNVQLFMASLAYKW